MSLRRSWSEERSRLFGPSRGSGAAAPVVAGGARAARPASQAPSESLPSQNLVGRDFARQAAPARRPAGPLAALVIGTLLAALLATSLRVDILRLRYALGEAVKEEASLLETTRALTVARRELRDPRHLRRLAEKRGFVRPARVIRLEPDGPGQGSAAGVPAPVGTEPR